MTTNRFATFLIGMAIVVLTSGPLGAQTAQQRLDQLNEQAAEVTNDAPMWLTFPGGNGPGKGKHIVLISGDDEYRSEEALPMLGKILSVHHGFKCSVLFAIDPETKVIQPDFQKNIPGMHLVAEADLVILGLRFRSLPDKDMKYFVDYVDAGKPILGTRTSTHAFNYEDDSESKYKNYHWRSKEWTGGFGQQVLGDTWIRHHGKHKKESCRGVIPDDKKNHPILKGVADVWGPSDVYGLDNLPDTANVIMKGAVLTGMNPDDKPVEGAKNEPMQPIAWTKGFKSSSGKEARIFCTTMGAATDLESEDLRRMVVNASYWCLGMEDSIPEKSKVDYVGEYNPTEYGFNIFQKDKVPADYDLKR